MSFSLLPNYLKANRKTLDFSQEEVGFLLGLQNGAQVSRHEQFNRVPTLETALAYEVIFKLSLSELFGGTYQEIEKALAKRAKLLIQRKGGTTNDLTLPGNKRLAELAAISS